MIMFCSWSWCPGCNDYCLSGRMQWHVICKSMIFFISWNFLWYAEKCKFPLANGTTHDQIIHVLFIHILSMYCSVHILPSFYEHYKLISKSCRKWKAMAKWYNTCPNNPCTVSISYKYCPCSHIALFLLTLQLHV